MTIRMLYLSPTSVTFTLICYHGEGSKLSPNKPIGLVWQGKRGMRRQKHLPPCRNSLMLSFFFLFKEISGSFLCTYIGFVVSKLYCEGKKSNKDTWYGLTIIRGEAPENTSGEGTGVM